MDLKLISFLALYVANVYGKASKYCCYPERWESVNFIHQGQVASSTKKLVFTEGTEFLYVDGVNHRIASFSEELVGGFKIQVQILQLFNKNIMYVVENGNCKIYKIPPWTPLCVPDGATLAKKTYYGGDTKVDVDVYTATSGTNTLYLTIARKGCVPVYISTEGQSEAGSSLSFKTYSNITLGIKDQSVFNIPSSCVNMTDSPMILVKHHGLY